MGKKGGAKNKLAKMSEEERARYLQHRADIEEEAKRRKQQLIAMYMKNKLKKEDAFTRLNLAKINQEWRYILRQLKCKEMRCEIKEMEHLFTDCIDRKNRMIRRLLCDLDESEEIYATMLHTHMENIEKLIGIHRDRLEYLQGVYIKEKQRLLGQNKHEVERYMTQKRKCQRDLEAVYYGLEEKADVQNAITKDHQQKKQDDLKNMMNIKLESMTRERELEMESLWRQFQAVLNGYLKYQEQYRNEYIDLRRRDTDETRTIKNHYLEVARTTELISDLKTHYESLREEHDFGVKELGKYKRDMQRRYEDLKSEFEKNLLNDRENFKYLILTSEQSIRHLNDIFKMGESLLQLSSVSRKLETEEEKILPFGPKKIMFQYSEEELRTVPDIFENDKNLLLYNFENFWLRFNTVRVDCAALEEEKTTLREENILLKRRLKEYLTNVNVVNGGGVVEVTQGCFAQRPSSMKIEKVIHIDLTKSTEIKRPKPRPVTCIEGNLSVAVRSRQLVDSKIRMNSGCLPIVQFH